MSDDGNERKPKKMEIMKSQESRGRDRTVSNTVVKLKWSGVSGERRFATGKVLDSSDSGIRVEIAEPIQIRSYVTLEASELNQAGWAGWGSVRYCLPKRSKYVIGLELSAGARWN
jgi:hypothetical protein